MTKDDPLIGRRLANFQVERPIGRGGMAQVYYGMDVKLNRPVAIKVIDARYRDDPSYAKRFVQEARSIATWRHENIIHIHYADDEDGFYYYVMEYVEGQDLSAILAGYQQQGQLMPYNELLHIGQGIAKALDYAHKKGMIHRDIKPANVMVSPEGRVVVMDFGLAMDVEVGSSGEVFGSARYIAPEQARNSAQAVAQSDIYALGVIMYEALTGQVPFDDPSSTAVALQHLTMPPPPPRQINPNISVETEAVLLKALDKSPQKRYQTGQELIAALEQTLLTQLAYIADAEETRPSKLELPLPVMSASPAATVNPMMAAGGGAVVVLILLLLGYMMFSGGSDSQATPTVIAAANPTVLTTTAPITSPETIVIITPTVAMSEATTVVASLEVSPTVAPMTTAPTVVADSEADFSETLTTWAYLWGKPKSNIWEAMQHYGANHYGKPCWYTIPNHVRTCNNFGNPGNNDNIAWRWTSTVSGPLEIKVQARKDSSGGDGVVISVYQGKTDSFPLLEMRTADGVINQTIPVKAIQQNEAIYFVMNKNGTETLDDTEFRAIICQPTCP